MLTFLSVMKDWSNEFRRMWEGRGYGEVSYTNTIRVGFDGKAEEESILQALNKMPTNEPEINSRIVVLVAHSQHAYPIMQMAAKIEFQPDTVWAGTSGWIGVDLSRYDTSWMGSQPGLIGVRPYQGEDRSVHQSFMSVFKETFGWDALPNFAPQLIDAILTIALTFASVMPDQYIEGDAVVAKMRNLTFDGVSGHIQFNDLGDLQNPQYSITQLQRIGGNLEWVSVGISGNTPGTASFSKRLCFPEAGCVTSLNAVPSDRYPVPPMRLPDGVVVAISVIAILLLAVAVKYWRSRRSKRNLKQELRAFQDSIVGMRTASVDYIPSVTLSYGSRHGSRFFDAVSDRNIDVEQALPLQNFTLTIKPQCKAVWCWKETPKFMSQHDDDSIDGDRATSLWIKYKEDCNSALEAAYQSGEKNLCPLPEYCVDFQKMIQTNLTTDFTREVKRTIVDPAKRGSMELKDKTVSLDAVRNGDQLPKDIRNEPQMCLVKGDIVQISKQRQDGWVFGTKLHHEDEVIARNFVLVATKDVPGSEEANVFADTGWFPMNATDIPSSDDLVNLQKSVGGDTGALEAPQHWDPVKDPTCVQSHRLKTEDAEYKKVEAAFLSTLKDRNIKITKIERIQNLAMWQSYVVKRQTVCIRETDKKQSKQTKNPDDVKAQAAKMKSAMHRFERSWLWHGTNAETLPKILQQGFNRSFCGKNATMFGKGVYFARDASYSSHKTYAMPDTGGRQYVLACKVVVGEYACGVKDAIAPSIRDPRTQSLYDSTVNRMDNPGIYVTYHDAQAYPEVRFLEADCVAFDVMCHWCVGPYTMVNCSFLS